MSNVAYEMQLDGVTAKGTLPDGTEFLVDADMLPLIQGISFYLCGKGTKYSGKYLMDQDGKSLHEHLFPHRVGFEVDHINLDTLDNRRVNIRYCTAHISRIRLINHFSETTHLVYPG